MNVLVVAAHPDDEVLGCGGTIARLVEEGHDVYIGILGEGSTSREQKRENADLALVEELGACSQNVARFLGARDLFMYGLPDNRFDSLPLLDVVKLVEELIDTLQPDVVYTHHVGDLNIDHSILGRAVITATRPIPGCRVKELYSFEIPSSTEWTFQRLEPIFRPNWFLDISSHFDAKVKALSMYEGEVRPFPHPRSPEALQAIARRWGSVVGVECAEAFELIRSIR